MYEKSLEILDSINPADVKSESKKQYEEIMHGRIKVICELIVKEVKKAVEDGLSCVSISVTDYHDNYWEAVKIIVAKLKTKWKCRLCSHYHEYGDWFEIVLKW